MSRTHFISNVRRWLDRLTPVAGTVLLCATLTQLAAKDKARMDAYQGCCGASAAVALDATHFAVGSDEDNRLRIYRRDRPGAPESVTDLNDFLAVGGKPAEADIEGAAKIGNRVYWIGSHGRNPDGKLRPERHSFFATEIATNGGRLTFQTTGRPYHDLMVDLAADSRYRQFRLRQAERLAPKEKGGLNIEGLTATPDGRLLIGFRNPLPGDKAMLAPLLNPVEVANGATARFGDPLLVDLEGNGIRDLAQAGGTYYIIGGSYHGGGQPVLYQWDGKSAKAGKIEGAVFRHFNAEALVIYPDTGAEKIQLLSDDGTSSNRGSRCQESRPDQRSFRSLWFKP
ncbi:MAG TPA: DUF3616 domain-containing protein [Verrucomicrobiae bacterium]|nr:DUF3616 domain-containing protein [Verrucomicrobiae bacterium]